MKGELLGDPYVNWRHDSLVSYVTEGRKTITGTAIVWKGKESGRLHYKIRLTTTDRAGDIIWVDENIPWAVGLGHHVKDCTECAGKFRTNNPTEPLCPTCGGKQP
jgi:hypothetical protein